MASGLSAAVLRYTVAGLFSCGWGKCHVADAGTSADVLDSFQK